MRTVGQNIAKIRDRLGLSQVDLADRLKMRQPSLWKLENSKGLPEGATLLKVAVALPATVEELLDGVDAAYDKIRNDLTRHARTGQSGSHPDGESDAPAATRILKERQQRSSDLAREIEKATSTLVQITLQLRAEAEGAAPPKTRSERRTRKAG